MNYERLLFFRIMTTRERSPGQDLPEVDVPPVASIAVAAAVVAVVVTRHHRLALHLAHRHARLAYQKSHRCWDPRPLNQEGPYCRCKDVIRVLERSITANQLGPSGPARNIAAATSARKHVELRELSPAPLLLLLPPPLPVRPSVSAPVRRGARRLLRLWWLVTLKRGATLCERGGEHVVWRGQSKAPRSTGERLQCAGDIAK